jgi:hypothetical protein
LLLLGGCAKFQTAHECGAFVSAINGWKGQAPKPLASAAASTPSAAAIESRTLAERYEELAKRIDALALTSPELLPRAQRYQKLAREASAALRDVAEAVEKGEAARARRRRVEFDDLARGETPLVAEINGICR